MTDPGYPQPDAIVLGRLVTDLYPLQSQTPLEEVRTFERFTGGYGGNVGIGLARLGVRPRWSPPSVMTATARRSCAIWSPKAWTPVG